MDRSKRVYRWKVSFIDGGEAWTEPFSNMTVMRAERHFGRPWRAMQRDEVGHHGLTMDVTLWCIMHQLSLQPDDASRVIAPPGTDARKHFESLVADFELVDVTPEEDDDDPLGAEHAS